MRQTIALYDDSTSHHAELLKQRTHKHYKVLIEASHTGAADSDHQDSMNYSI